MRTKRVQPGGQSVAPEPGSTRCSALAAPDGLDTFQPGETYDASYL